jgi:hypothetical protein
MSDISPSSSFTPLHPGERPVLIRLDSGFLERIEAERYVLTGGTGHRVPRTTMIRILLKEALAARARARGEKVPEAVAVAL